jgi:hypothetical protein
MVVQSLRLVRSSPVRINDGVGTSNNQCPTNRDCKFTGKPSVQKEIRLSGAANIKKRTGIEYIEDFLNFDIKDFYDKWEDKFIEEAEIDPSKIGIWHRGWERRNKEFLEIKRNKIKTATRGLIFCDVYGIKTFPQLKSLIGEKKGIIRSKKGPQTEWDKKILDVKYNKFRTRT